MYIFANPTSRVLVHSTRFAEKGAKGDGDGEREREREERSNGEISSVIVTEIVDWLAILLTGIHQFPNLSLDFKSSSLQITIIRVDSVGSPVP